MKQGGIAFDVNCLGYRFIGSGNNVSLSSFLEKSQLKKQKMTE